MTSGGHESSFFILRFHITPITAVIFTIIGFLILTSLVRVLYHQYEVKAFPESAVIVVVGIVFGSIVFFTNPSFNELLSFDANIFFLFLLPPIIFEAGYNMDRGFFISQMGTILVFAVLGTLLNSLAIGLCLWSLSFLFPFHLSLPMALAFGSLIAAVDPVAVLAIFDSMHVEDTLYMLVFGESLLNDAVSIVLFQLFLSMEGTHDDPTSLVFLGIAKFLVVFLGGLVIGVIAGLLTLFFTKFCKKIAAIEPLFVMMFAYLGYLGSETFGVSGIVSLLFNGMVVSRYIDSNLNKKSKTSIKVDVKLLAGATETLVFMYLGLSSINVFASNTHTHEPILNGPFIGFTILFCLLWRFVSVFLLTFFSNMRRIQPISFGTQAILAYGGLRGAVSFGLAVSIPDSVEAKPYILSAAMFEVLFTVFIQGGTIKPLLKLLSIRSKSEVEESKMVEYEVLPRSFKPFVSAVEAVAKDRTAAGLVSKKIIEKSNAFVERYLIRGLSVEERQLCAMLDKIHHLQDKAARQKLSENDQKLLNQYQQAHAELSIDPNVNLDRLTQLPQYQATMHSLASRVHRARFKPKEQFKEAALAVKTALHNAKISHNSFPTLSEGEGDNRAARSSTKTAFGDVALVAISRSMSDSRTHAEAEVPSSPSPSSDTGIGPVDATSIAIDELEAVEESPHPKPKGLRRAVSRLLLPENEDEKPEEDARTKFKRAVMRTQRPSAERGYRSAVSDSHSDTHTGASMWMFLKDRNTMSLLQPSEGGECDT